MQIVAAGEVKAHRPKVRRARTAKAHRPKVRRARTAKAHRPQVRGARETEERLIRLCANRPDHSVEIRVHYEIRRCKNCDIYRIITIEEID